MHHLFNFSQTIISAWEEFANYYEFGGGKEKMAKIELQEERDRLKLIETKSIVDIWRQAIRLGANKETLELCEKCVRLTLQLDWGDAVTDCIFNYDTQKVLCSTKDFKVEI